MTSRGYSKSSILESLKSRQINLYRRIVLLALAV